MIMHYIISVIYIYVLAVVSSLASSHQLSALELPESEYLALSDLYFSTDGGRWNWETPYALHGNPWTFATPAANPCTDSWQGVTCAVKSGAYHITELILDNLRIRGFLPNSVCNLTSIRTLSLFGNSLRGIIPNCVGNLTFLTDIDLSKNNLIGTIPETLRQLTQLESVYLNKNALNGTLEVFCDIKTLQTLSLYENALTGTIPECIGALTLLRIFYIYENSMNGTIPAVLGNLTELTQLSLNYLHLTGTIPSTLGNLSNLIYLFISNNNLTGTLPASLGNLSSLNQIGVGANRISGSVPESFGQLRHLESISMGDCFLTGSLPSGLFDLPIMVFFEFNTNHLTGTIPESVGNMKLLGDISMENNKLTGSFPNSLFNLTHLVNIYLSGNQLTGTLLSEISKQPRVFNYFQLYSNQMSGTIPNTIEYLAGLFEINLGYNHFHGTIPASIGNMHTVAELDLSNNLLSGIIPDSFQNLTQLAVLSLQGNKLTGRLDSFVSPLQERMATVQLDNNQFTGELPAVLFELRSLISLSIVGSCLHGTIPNNICNATRLEALILQGLTTGSSCRSAGIPSMSLHSARQFEGSLPLCLLSMPRLRTLLLSSNGFTGRLDNHGALLGRALSQLDLSHNLLSGSIPNNIQNHNWSVLDLSHNKLNGVLNLPLKISTLHLEIENGTDITFHPSLYLDTNRLSGPVPNSVKQLQSNLSVLAGNLFQCRYDKTDLPQHDSDVHKYECASNSFNVSIYLWLGLTLFAVGFIVLYYRLYNVSVESLNVAIVGTVGPQSALTHVSDLFTVYERLRKVVGYCTLFCILILLPYYIIVSQDNSTHTHTYAYIVSALYTTGVTPFAVTTVLLFLLLTIVVVYFFRKWHTVPYVDTAVLFTWRQLFLVGVVFAVSNTAIVLGFNVLFVYTVLFASSEAQTVAQVALSVFKLVWSMAVSPLMMRKIDAYFLPQSNDPTSKARPNYFTLQLLVGLFNNIAIPCLVVMAIDPNCFGDVFLPPGARTVYYLLPVCERNGFLNPCQFQSVDITSLRFTPPFTYSYQCSASFITSYAPAFIYMSISNVFLHPVLQTVLLYIRSRAADPGMVHKWVSKLLPRLLRPPSEKAYQKGLQQKRPLVGGGAVMVTLFTQFGILLTFGAIFPPVALAMAVSIASIVYLMRFKVQRFVQAAVDAQLLGYLDVINAECAGVGTREQMQLAVKIIVCYCCAFYTLFLFDALGDTEGFKASAWVLIVVPLLPITIFVVYELLHVPTLVMAEGDESTLPADVELKDIRIKEKLKVAQEESISNVPLQFTDNPILCKSVINI